MYVVISLVVVASQLRTGIEGTGTGTTACRNRTRPGRSTVPQVQIEKNGRAEGKCLSAANSSHQQ